MVPKAPPPSSRPRSLAGCRSSSTSFEDDLTLGAEGSGPPPRAVPSCGGTVPEGQSVPGGVQGTKTVTRPQTLHPLGL